MSSTTPGRETGGFRPAREQRVMRSHTRGFFPEPVAAKVPEITFLFWVIKILTTAGGEATSDYLALDLGSRLEAGCIEAGVFVVALGWQFRTPRYVAAAYSRAGSATAPYAHPM